MEKQKKKIMNSFSFISNNFKPLDIFKITVIKITY